MTSTIARAQTAKGTSNPLASPPRVTTTTTASLSTSASASGPTLLHAHRQSHTPSKLPAFRFTDRKRESTIIVTAPISASVGAPNADQEAQGLGTEHEPDHRVPLTTHTSDPTNTHTTHNNPAHIIPTQEKQNESSHQPAQHQRQSFLAASPRSRASTFQSSAASPQTSVKRPLSFPHTPLAAATQHTSTPSAAPVGASSSVTKSPSTTPIAKPHAPRSAASSSASNAIDCPSDPSTSLSSKRLLAVDASQSSEPSEKIKEWAQGQRELLLPKSLDSNSFESTQPPPPKRSNTDEKKLNVARRPPVSFKPPPGATAPSTPGKPVIPPIRAFRSSGSRRSVVLDMNIRNARPDNADDADGSSHRDRTLRALEGRHNDDPLQSTPDSAANGALDGADDGDMFLRIARQEFARKTNDGARDGSTGSRVTRTSSHRRPYSAAIPTYQPTSPPRISRRLSDQQETKRSRAYDDDHTVAVDGILRSTGYREAMSSTQEHSRTRTSTSGLKPAPTTPRTLTFQDQESPSSYNRRRGSISENGPTRPTYKNSSLSYSKTYNPSPLVPRQDSTDTSHGFEGTESTSSTNAPSVMWDEVEKMSSQIQRMQMKGSLPASSSAISRASDERPPTATTTVTTMSASPKRASGNSGYHAADASSTTSSLKEPHPILHAALAKTKSVVSPEVYQALETTATDAMALAGMMGIAGQPGPISSGASSIGNGMTLTDRQLRRKADSVCRSLTELCIAITEDASRKSPPATVIQSIEKPERETVMSPTATNFLSAPPARRPSAVEMPINLTASPRTTARLEDRRTTVINGSALPSPRFNAASAAEPASAGRKSSLLITRTRRAGTEEPEDGRRSSVLFRSRRAGTEEPDEGRKSSLLVRNRRNTNGDDDEEASRFRAPSRATTDLGGLRAINRDREAVAASSGDATLGASALPRRRLPPSSLGSSRLAAPATTPTSSRRYIDRQTPDRETTVNDKIERERSQTQYLQRPTALLGRSGSLSRRNRESALSGVSTTATAGGYR